MRFKWGCAVIFHLAHPCCSLAYNQSSLCISINSAFNFKVWRTLNWTVLYNPKHEALSEPNNIITVVVQHLIKGPVTLSMFCKYILVKQHPKTEQILHFFFSDVAEQHQDNELSQLKVSHWSLFFVLIVVASCKFNFIFTKCSQKCWAKLSAKQRKFLY